MDLFKFFKHNSSVVQEGELEILRKRKEIVKQLKVAQQRRTIVGITSPSLGLGMFLVGVEEVHSDDQVVDLCPYDVTGTLLALSSIEVASIKSICAFNSPYRNPFLASPVAAR
ncbi:MAG TPA: hypothetical protein VGD65_22200 [Chryseosolibacter sp.]